MSHFHLRVTAAGCNGLGPDAEAELQREVADIDTVDDVGSVDEEDIVVTLRGVGELQPHNPANRITLSEDIDEFGVRRAFVAVGNPIDPPQPGETIQTTNGRELWDAMDKMADEVRVVVVGAHEADDRVRTRDGLGTTHHEAGTLWMGTAA